MKTKTKIKKYNIEYIHLVHSLFKREQYFLSFDMTNVNKIDFHKHITYQNRLLNDMHMMIYMKNLNHVVIGIHNYDVKNESAYIHIVSEKKGQNFGYESMIEFENYVLENSNLKSLKLKVRNDNVVMKKLAAKLNYVTIEGSEEGFIFYEKMIK